MSHGLAGKLPATGSVARFLVKDIRVAVVPGSSFYHRPELGQTQVRFTFCKRDETLAAAEEGAPPGGAQ